LLTGDIRNQVDKIWDSFWSGGISNPVEVIEQITYLIFLRLLDERHTLEEQKARQLGRPMERRMFPPEQEHLRWSNAKFLPSEAMFALFEGQVFPFLRRLAPEGSAYGRHMANARFTIPTAALLEKVVGLVDGLPLGDRDTKGDLYEYMLGKLATAGQNGQFRTPRHIIQLMVELVAPTPKDVICDPALGTAGFLVSASH
jgi:type I restriction enzyme M protein